MSTLPSDDDDFREIIEDFVVFLQGQLKAFRAASAGNDLALLGRLAHTLKGTAGTAGFDAFTEPAKELEQLAAQGGGKQISAVLAVVEGLASRISIPSVTRSEM